MSTSVASAPWSRTTMACTASPHCSLGIPMTATWLTAGMVEHLGSLAHQNAFRQAGGDEPSANASYSGSEAQLMHALGDEAQQRGGIFRDTDDLGAQIISRSIVFQWSVMGVPKLAGGAGVPRRDVHKVRLIEARPLRSPHFNISRAAAAACSPWSVLAPG